MVEKMHTATLDKARHEAALAAWKATGSQSNAGMADSFLGDILEIAIADFVSIYNCARGHQIDPAYVSALRHDMLIAIEAAAKADPAKGGPNEL
jgi:hypothetical protein